jgi:hypothetical protein
MTALALSVWLQSSYPTMPNIILTQDEIRKFHPPALSASARAVRTNSRLSARAPAASAAAQPGARAQPGLPSGCLCPSASSWRLPPVLELPASENLKTI